MVKVINGQCYYFEEVKKLDEGKLSLKEFCKIVYGEYPLEGITRALALHKIYKEDGGKKFETPKEFIKCCKPKKIDLEMLKDGIYECMIYGFKLKWNGKSWEERQ